jgi:putative protease
MSQFQYDRSANRGDCLQPCRREYRITDTDGETSFRMGDQVLLSPEDLCTLPFIEKLFAAGVASLKIEGRARSAEYVSTVTSAYRRAVDFYFTGRGRRGFPARFSRLKAELMDELGSVFNRGLSSGFFLGKPVDQWTRSSGNRATTSKRPIGEVVNFYAKPGVAEIFVRNAEFRVGDTIMVQGPTTGCLTETVGSIEIDHGPCPAAARGSRVAVKLSGKVRRNDRVYLVLDRQGRRKETV